MISFIFITTLLIFIIAYLSYGRFLSRIYAIDSNIQTPSHSMIDGYDYVPTHKMVLFGHHFSSIAGAGPIIGPIIATLTFGWMPVILWVIIGSIFIGGVHDFSAIVVSMRHKGTSIANVAKEYLNKRARLLFLIFVWLALVYVITVFTDITADAFKEDGGVASSSIFYIVLAMGCGISIYKLNISIFKASLLFIPLVFVGIWIGQEIPLRPDVISELGGDVKKVWSILILIYCLAASILPVWFLLQPRDYLSSYLLYSSVLAGMFGIIIGGFELKFPPFFQFHSENLGYLFPSLFVIVACGAISGFHSLVASGTTSKQINNEKDACFIGYGGMLVEGLVAVISIIAVAIISTGDPLIDKQPMQIYSAAMGKFSATLGLSEQFGNSFGILSLSAFILTTLDTATRLGRYVIQELFGGIDKFDKYLATILTIILPFIFIFIQFTDPMGRPIPSWKAIWPVFGASNQLLGALALLVIYIWQKKSGNKTLFISIPMIFMLLVTLTSLFFLIIKYKLSIIGIIAILLFCLAIFLCTETYLIYRKMRVADIRVGGYL